MKENSENGREFRDVEENCVCSPCNVSGLRSGHNLTHHSLSSVHHTDHSKDAEILLFVVELSVSQQSHHKLVTYKSSERNYVGRWEKKKLVSVL
jgi:hypothetical protein